MKRAKKSDNSNKSGIKATSRHAVFQIALYNYGNGAQFAHKEPPPLSYHTTMRRHSARLPLLRFYAANVAFPKYAATRPKNAANFDSAAYFVQSCVEVVKTIYGVNSGLLRLFAFFGIISGTAASASNGLGA